MKIGKTLSPGFGDLPYNTFMTFFLHFFWKVRDNTVTLHFKNKNKEYNMRKCYLTVAIALTLVGSILSTSCIGKFALFNKVRTWNQQVGGKVVNEIVFFCFWVIPVYEISALADLLVINSIEFWSGSNPVTAHTTRIQGEDGTNYLVKCDKKGYTIKSERDGSIVRLAFNEEENSWAVEANGESITFMTFIDDTHVKMLTPDGDFRTVELSQQGLYAYQDMIGMSNLAMR